MLVVWLERLMSRQLSTNYNKPVTGELGLLAGPVGRLMTSHSSRAG